MNTNKSNRFISRQIPFVMLFVILFLSSCTDSKVVEEGSSSSLQPNEMSISRDQFREAGMEIGSMIDTVFRGALFVNGFVDVLPENKAIVSSPFGGKVAAIFVKVGQKVQKGQNLVLLENPDFAELQEDYLASASQLKNIEMEYKRMQSLNDDKIVSEKDFQQAETNYIMAASKVKSLEAKLRLLNIDLSSLTINTLHANAYLRAPIGGYITAINHSIGEWIIPENGSIEVMNVEYPIIKLEVYEKDISQLSENLELEIKQANSSNYFAKAVLIRSNRKIDEQKRTLEVTAQLSDKNPSDLLPGMYVSAKIFTKNMDVYCLPSAAVTEIDDKNYALLVVSQDTNNVIFSKVEIIPGQNSFGLTEVKNHENFKSGQQFLYKGGFQLMQSEE